jgi:uncharacterized protein YjiS (DUF1127 family)
MTTVHNTHTASHARPAGPQVAWSWPVTALSHLANRIKTRREMNRLLGLPDYLLKDVGLQRHDIQREAVKPILFDHWPKFG